MAATVPQRPLMTVSETAERLRVSEKTVRRLASRNDLPTLRVGGSVRVDADELERWLGRQMSAMGGSFVALDGAAMGRSNVVDDPAERGTGPPEGARQSSPARLAGDER
jgi:excisionase family DNA binding protein